MSVAPAPMQEPTPGEEENVPPRDKGGVRSAWDANPVAVSPLDDYRRRASTVGETKAVSWAVNYLGFEPSWQQASLVFGSFLLIYGLYLLVFMVFYFGKLTYVMPICVLEACPCLSPTHRLISACRQMMLLFPGIIARVWFFRMIVFLRKRVWIPLCVVLVVKQFLLVNTEILPTISAYGSMLIDIFVLVLVAVVVHGRRVVSDTVPYFLVALLLAAWQGVMISLLPRISLKSMQLFNIVLMLFGAILTLFEHLLVKIVDSLGATRRWDPQALRTLAIMLAAAIESLKVACLVNTDNTASLFIAVSVNVVSEVVTRNRLYLWVVAKINKTEMEPLGRFASLYNGSRHFVEWVPLFCMLLMSMFGLTINPAMSIHCHGNSIIPIFDFVVNPLFAVAIISEEFLADTLSFLVSKSLKIDTGSSLQFTTFGRVTHVWLIAFVQSWVCLTVSSGMYLATQGTVRDI